MRVLRLPFLLIAIAAASGQAWSQSDGPVIITGLSPDAVGHFDADQCRGCDATRDASGLCDNSCVSCHDAARTTFAGDGTTSGCGQFDGNQGACEAAWQLVNGLPVSCAFASGFCGICDSSSQKNGACTNTCFPCADAGRTTFAGGSFLPDGCRGFDTKQTECEAAWVLNGFANAPLACFFDSATNECHACEVGERIAGQCVNTCARCEDSTFGSFTNEPGDDGCEALAGNQAGCESTWHYANGHVPAPCFFTAGTEVNQGGFLFIQDGFDRLGPLVTNGKKLAVCLGCNGTTAAEGFDAGFDESTLPGLGWTRTTITDPAAIADFLTSQSSPAIGDAGIVYTPSQQADTPHNGIGEDQIAVLNQQKSALGAFVAGGGGFFALNQSRIQGGFGWLDAVVPGAQARNGDTCVQQLAFTPPGETTFPHVDDPLLETLDDHTSGYFLGDFGGLAVLANGQCRDVTCKNPGDTKFLGTSQGFFDDLCRLETDEAMCNAAWQFGGFAASCAFDTQAGQCLRCGRAFDGEPLCANECPGCDDVTHTQFAEQGCESVQEPGPCAISWAIGREGLNVSCFFDELAGFCRDCETEDEITGDCTNTCEPPPGPRAVVLGPPFAETTPAPTATATATQVPTATATPVPTVTRTPVPTPTVAPSPHATATPGVAGPVGRFQCYAIQRQPFASIPGVEIDDDLGTGAGRLRRPTRLCAPASVNGAGADAPSDPRHLLGYELRDREPRFEQVKHVTVSNELAADVPLDLDFIRPRLVMTPTRKSTTGDPGAPDGIGLDHFQCYRSVGDRQRADDLVVVDQFGTLTLDVKRPFQVCLPADKNGEGIVNPDVALACYRIRPAKRPRFQGAHVFVHDQFGALAIEVKRPTELCLPSTIGEPIVRRRSAHR